MGGVAALESTRGKRPAEERLAELAASAGPLRRVLAAVAARFVAMRAHERLCFARLSDYARERPGLSARQLQDLSRVHRALAGLPALERALVANELPWSKVRLLARVAVTVDEAGWIARARALPTRQLEQEVRRQAGSTGASDGEDGEPITRVRVCCTPVVRAKWERARELAERVAGCRLRADEALELVVAEASSGFAVGSVAPGPAGPRPSLHYLPGCLRAPGVARASARRLPPAIAALAAGLEEVDAFELDRRLCQVVRMEQTLDAEMAPLLRAVRARTHAWGARTHAWGGGDGPFPTYARDQLGMSAGKARALIRLERAGDLCPELRAAYRSGRLSWVKAQCLLPLLLLDSPGAWQSRWVSWAERVTVRRLERDVSRALLLHAGHVAAWRRCKRDPARAQDPIPSAEQQLCAHDVDLAATEVLEWRLSRDVAALFFALRRRLSFPEMIDHALATWSLRDPSSPLPDPIIERDGYRCAVPGCTSRRNLQDHHIAFRAAGGSDAASNRITLCAWHHLRCLHAGWMRIRGQAPDALVFELPFARYRSGDVLLAPRTSAGANRAA